MKQIIEYLPIIIFTITYFYTRDIFFATLILLIGLFIQVCLEYLLEKKVSKKTKIIFGISLLFGGSTIFFRNEEFLFWRPTVINWIFSVLLLSFEFFSWKNLLKIDSPVSKVSSPERCEYRSALAVDYRPPLILQSLTSSK